MEYVASSTSTDFCHSGANDLQLARRVSFTGCPNILKAGESPSLQQWILQYWINAQESLFQYTEQPVQVVEMSFFIDLTVVSAVQLLCE